MTCFRRSVEICALRARQDGGRHRFDSSTPLSTAAQIAFASAKPAPSALVDRDGHPLYADQFEVVTQT